MQTNNFKRYIQFMIIVLAAGSIYPLIYLKTSYQETILKVFNMSLSELNTIFTALGFAFIIGYFPSGWLSDRVSTRLLIAFSLLVTGVTGIWFAQIPNIQQVYIIFVIWGFSTVFTFWSAHMKVVKLLAKKEEQARFFGILDGGRGVVEAVLASIALIIFTSILGNSTKLADQKAALVGVIYMYSVILIILGVLSFIFLDKEQKAVSSEQSEQAQNTKVEKLPLAQAVKLLLTNKFVWLLGFIIFCSYTVTWTIYYLGGFLQTNVKVDAATVGTVMLITLWMRPIGGLMAGFLGDKFGKTNVLAIVLTFAAISLFILASIPYTSPQNIFFALVIETGLMIYAIRGLYWSLLDDCEINDSIVGMSIGIVSLLGYLPDLLIPIVNTELFTKYGANQGYNAYFIMSAVLGLIGLVLVAVFKKFQVANK